MEAKKASKTGSPHDPGSGPLRVKVRLRPEIEELRSGEASFDQFCRVNSLRSVARKPRRARSLSLVDEIDFVAFVDQP